MPDVSSQCVVYGRRPLLIMARIHEARNPQNTLARRIWVLSQCQDKETEAGGQRKLSKASWPIMWTPGPPDHPVYYSGSPFLESPGEARYLEHYSDRLSQNPEFSQPRQLNQWGTLQRPPGPLVPELMSEQG